MQALGGITPDRGVPAAADRSGGADLAAEQINVGGDVTGRDKIIQIHAEAGATVYLGQPGSASVKIDDGAARPADDPPAS
jgi:hypothetical protein